MRETTFDTLQLHDWLARMRAGDLAREELMCRSMQRLKCLAHRLLKGDRLRRWIQEEDLVQEAAMRLLAAVRSQTPNSTAAFFSLAAGLIRRELINLARKLYGSEGMAAHHSSMPYGSTGATGPPDEREDPSKEIIERERAIQLHEKVELLPEEVRQIVDLHIYGELSLPEAARELEITDKQAEYRWLKARQRLSELLDPDWLEP